jgi:hypothetical protein
MSVLKRYCGKPTWDPVPLCWSCAGGKGLPPKTERKEQRGEDSANPGNHRMGVSSSAVVLDLGGEKTAGAGQVTPSAAAPAEHTAPSTGASVSPVHCMRAGCQRTSMHVHISALGECRRLLAAGLIGAEPSVLPQDHWERASELGAFGERLVVEYLRNQRHTLWNTLLVPVLG